MPQTTQTEYVVNLQDYRNATNLYLRVRPFKKAQVVFSLWIIPGLAIALFLLWLFFRFHGSSPAQSASMLSNLTPLFIVAALMPAIREITIRRTFSALFPKRKSRVFVFSFTGEGSTYAAPDRGEGRFLWEGLTQFAENPKIVLLFTSKITFIMIPKRAYNEAQWAAFRELAQKKITKS